MILPGGARAMTAPFRVVVADPPWKFGDRLSGKTRGAERHYQTLTAEEISVMALPQIADDAALFLWRVAAMQEEALHVVRSWGFTLKSELVWRKLTPNEKVHFGMGRYVRASHETCLIAVRGRCFPRVRDVRSIFDAIRPAQHSAKPEAFFELVERMYEGPYLEVFARRQRPGWTCIGDEMPA